MTDTILHSGPISATADGSVGATSPVVDFGAGRRVNGKVKYEVISATAGGTFIMRVLLGASGFPTAESLSNRAVPGGSMNETFDVEFTNETWTEFDPSRLSQFAKANIIVAGGTIDLVITLSESTTLVIQVPSGDASANVYLTVADALLLLADCDPAFTAFAGLSNDRQAAVWAKATQRIEIEITNCPNGSPVIDGQTLLFPRTEATGNVGQDIIGLPPEPYLLGLALFAEEMAAAETAGESVDEPGEDKGLVEVEVGPSQADYRERYTADGKPGDFFESRQRIRALLSVALPRRAFG